MVGVLRHAASMPRDADTSIAAAEWTGVAGYERFRAKYSYTTADPSRFQAGLRTATVDGVRIGAWTTTPVSGVGHRPGEDPSALLITVASGSLRYALGARVVDAERGSIHLLSTIESVRFTIREPSRMLLVRVPSAFLRETQRAATARSIGPVSNTRITAGLSSLVEQVLDPDVGGAESPAARAVRSIALAAIEDSVPDTPDLGLRDRILDHIERRLGDPDLGPQSIADEFGISLRWVHHVFNVEHTTVARHIRVRRLEGVAALLRNDRRLPRIGALAERSGFASRDHLTRAFKARFGTTIGEYAALAAEGRAPQAADAGAETELDPAGRIG
jgi:AraC-like DNA-binding protein